MVHHTIIPCELWHRILGHIHFRALPGLQRIVKGMPSFDFVHDYIYRGCALGKNVKNNFPSSHTRPKGILELLTQMCVDPCLPLHLVGTFTMFYSLLISLVRLGFT